MQSSVFHKFFFPNESSSELEIPPSLEIDLPEIITIRNKYDYIWKVQTKEADGSWRFSDGWTKFVNDNSLRNMDLMRFVYSCEGLFDVKIYGQSACEKGTVRSLIASGSRSPPERETPSRVENAAGKKNRRRKVIDWLGKPIFRNGLAPKPRGTYFLTKCMPKRMNELYLPAGLMNDENFKVPASVTLVDPCGRTYTTMYRQWSNSRSFYKGGWGKLLRKNDINEDDVCICEFSKGLRPKYLFVSFLQDANRF